MAVEKLRENIDMRLSIKSLDSKSASIVKDITIKSPVKNLSSSF